VTIRQAIRIAPLAGVKVIHAHLRRVTVSGLDEEQDGAATWEETRKPVPLLSFAEGREWRAFSA
jgi:hypothetical protein